jgi:Putative transmembrane protein (PGPGW)
MQTRLKRLTILIAGWAFILLGVAGLFLPILQGVLFLLVGLLILSTEYVWAHRLLGKLRARFPKINLQFEKATARANLWMQRFKKSGPEETHKETQLERDEEGAESQIKKGGPEFQPGDLQLIDSNH